LSLASARSHDARAAWAARAASLEERVQWDESELRRATADVKRLRAALKEEKRRNEKLFSTLDLEREANTQAQAVISDMRTRLTENGSGQVSSRLSVGASFGGTSSGGAAIASSFPKNEHSLARSASLAGRASFAAMSSPAPQRTSSRSLSIAASSPFPDDDE
jgi:hypothetical protein